MEESANKDAFLDRLRSVHDALEAGRSQVAVELLVEMREQGFAASNLDEQIAVLRENPDERDVVQVDRWVQNLVGQMQRPEDAPLEGLDEVTGADAEPMGANELMPLSESSEVGIELQESPDEAPQEGVGSDVHGSVGEEPLMDQETGAGFDRDSQPATAVGEGSTAQELGGESEISEVDLEDDDDGFDGLPSVDFAVVESEAEEDDVFEADDELEPLEESPSGLDENEPTAAGGETEASEGENGGGEDDVFVQDMFGQGADGEPELEGDGAAGASGDLEDSEEIPELDEEGGDDEDVFVQDMFGDQTDGESGLDQGEATEAGDADDETITPGSEPDLEEGTDDGFVQGMFGEEDSGEEGVDGLFEDESTSTGQDGESSGFELNFGGGADDEESADDGGTADVGGDSDEWSALDAFESSELEADDSDFEFGDDPSTAVGQEDVDTAVGEQDPETAVGQQDPDTSAGGEVRDDGPGGDDTPSEEESDDDLAFGFDQQDSKPETPAGRDVSFGSDEGEEQEADPNQTRQPFSEDSEAAEQFAKQHFDDSPEEATRAGSVEELVGEENAALFHNDEEADGTESSGGSSFQDEESTAKSDMPDPESPEPAAFDNQEPTAQTGTPDPGIDDGPETSSPDEGPALFDDEEPTANNDSPEASAGLEDGGEEFDLGFENPGEDDSAGFDLGLDEGSDEETHQTPVPDGNLSDMAEATGEAGVEESVGDAPSEPTNEAMNPFAADEGMVDNSEPVPTGQDQESSPRYSMEASEGIEEEAEQESSSVETEENDALSDEEFFQLADELSEPSAASEPDDDSPTPTPHRGEPAIPQSDEPAMPDEETSRSGGMSGAASEQSDELAGINPHASAPSEPEETDEENGTGSYQSVPHDSSEADEESRDLESGAVRLINEAERLFEKGNLESAHDLVQSVLESSPNSERAQSLLESIEAEQEDDEPAATGEHQTVDSSQPPPLDAVPESEVDMAEVADQDFDHRFGFILSLVDGTVTVQDICELSSMSRQETLSVLADMVDQSVISVDE